MSINFNCPKCRTSFHVEEDTIDALYEHINECCRQLNCTKCKVGRYSSESGLIKHCIDEHSDTTATSKKTCTLCAGAKDYGSLGHHCGVKPDKTGKRLGRSMSMLPHVGDRVVALCKEWQYISASICSFDEDTMTFQVNWNDGSNESIGRAVDVENIALDNTPQENEIKVGTSVLFRQGTYDAGSTHKRGGKIWHRGIIVEVLRGVGGKKVYRGHHTKGELDGKCTSYKGYSYEFRNLTKHDFRLAPNILDVIHFVERHVETAHTDVYLSYDLVDSYKAVMNSQVDEKNIPESYTKFGYENMCDPADIETFLREQGLTVASQKRTGEQNLKQVASMINNAKVFIGCLSDKYVANNQCRMEFQYAKTSLQKPVIPLVVGQGSFNWVASVVGMLIAGELFIHFRSKDVEADKNAEVMTNIRKHIPATDTGVEDISEGIVEKEEDDKGPAEVFLSYCWTNSQLAEEAKQIKCVNGSKLSDPRFLKDKISERGYKVWLDVEQLESANADAGLFGQIVQGLKSAKLIIPCISDEYSKSQNCRMEFQFALKSLYKPVVPIIVGSGDSWRSSVVGALLSTHETEPIDLQGIEKECELEKKVSQIIRYIEAIIGGPRAQRRGSESSDTSSDSSSEESSDDRSSNGSKKKKLPPFLFRNADSANRAPTSIRAPNVGDRVVSHYKNFTYYMATVAEFDAASMTYTVDWDDDDPVGRVHPFDHVALDEPPEIDDIGVGTIIFFPQGAYVSEEINSECARYHEGEIAAVNRSKSGKVTVSGHHTKTGKGWKIITNLTHYNFEDVPLELIRLAPTAFDFLEVFYENL